MKAMASARLTASGWFIALLLVAFSASGLMAGVVTRQIGSLRWGSGSPSLTPVAASPTPGTPTVAGAFTLKIQLSPNPARPGQTLQLTVTSFTPASAPVPGVQCTPLQTDTSPNFAPWPSPQYTDASGQARWSVVLPSDTAPGTYQVHVQGEQATSPYHGQWYGTLVVASSSD